jgi:hypothetical protein
MTKENSFMDKTFTKKARLVLNELRVLMRAQAKHLEFVALYTDTLLGSLSKAEQRRVIAYLWKTYRVDLQGSNVKKELLRINRELDRLESRLYDDEGRVNTLRLRAKYRVAPRTVAARERREREQLRTKIRDTRKRVKTLLKQRKSLEPQGGAQ